MNGRGRALTVARARSLAVVLAGAIAAGFAVADASGQSAARVTVATWEQFVAAIGPDREIVVKKGVYRVVPLSGAKNPWTEFPDLGGSGELSFAIKGVKNLRVVGEPGVEFVAPLRTQAALALSNCDNVSVEGVSFSRESPKDGWKDVAGGMIAVFSSTRVAFSKCSIRGANSVAFSVDGCRDLELSGCSIRGVDGVVFLLLGSEDVRVRGCEVSGCAGAPLAFLSSTRGVSFVDCEFGSNTGDVFVEIYGDGRPSRVEFSKCRFYEQRFSWFAGGTELPGTATDCVYRGSSFDATWPKRSVAPAYSVADERASHVWKEAGLLIRFDPAWSARTSGGMLMIETGSGQVAILGLRAGAISKGVDPFMSPDRAAEDGLAKVKAAVRPLGAGALDAKPTDWHVLGDRAFVIRCSGTLGKLFAETVLVATRGEWFALLGVSASREALAPGSPIMTALADIELSD